MNRSCCRHGQPKVAELFIVNWTVNYEPEVSSFSVGPKEFKEFFESGSIVRNTQRNISQILPALRHSPRGQMSPASGVA